MRVDHDGVAADVGEILHVVLDVEFVGAAIAAADDHDVDLGVVDHRHRIVDRRMHDVGRAARQRGALAFGAFGELQVDVQSVPGEEALLDRHIERQRAGVRERVDVDEGRFGGVTDRSARLDSPANSINTRQSMVPPWRERAFIVIIRERG